MKFSHNSFLLYEFFIQFVIIDRVRNLHLVTHTVFEQKVSNLFALGIFAQSDVLLREAKDFNFLPLIEIQIFVTLIMDDTILDFFEDDPNVKVVVIKTFYWESKAYLYAARLKEAGIPSFISNSNINSVLHIDVGGIKLNVRAIDVDTAAEIVKKMDEAQKDENESFHDADKDDIFYEKQVAENKIEASDGRGFSAKVILVILIVLILLYTFSFKFWDLFHLPY